MKEQKNSHPAAYNPLLNGCFIGRFNAFHIMHHDVSHMSDS